MTRRLVQFVVAGIVLGFGIACLLGARFGADGYSMLNDGVATALDAEFLLVNVVVSAVFVAVGWIAGQVPGIGTICIPLVVGAAVSLFERVIPEPDAIAPRIGLFAVGFALMIPGVAAYMGTDLGIGPAEAPPLAFDPPVPFRWSYAAVQVGSALTGWLLGSPIGVGTVVVVLLIGPLVDRVRPFFEQAPQRPSVRPWIERTRRRPGRVPPVDGVKALDDVRGPCPS